MTQLTQELSKIGKDLENQNLYMIDNEEKKLSGTDDSRIGETLLRLEK